MPPTRTLDFRNLVWALVAALGVGQFLVVLRYAASCYPETYQWDSHFISDLGRQVTLEGHDNTVNSRLFAASSFTLGVSLLPFLLVFPSAFQRGRLLLRILAVATVLGLIGIGQTPYDEYFVLHHVALLLWIVPMVVMAIALPILLFREGGSSRHLCTVSGVLFAASIAYASVGSHSGYVIMQKIVVVISLLWFVSLATTVVIVTTWTLSDRQQSLVAQAAWYERKLRQARY